VLTPRRRKSWNWAKNEGKSVSHANPLDSSQSANSGPLTTEVLDPNERHAIRKNRGRRSKGAPTMPKSFGNLAAKSKQAEDAKKKEVEKPRVVVDVYRGDKHVQELFR